MNKAERLERKKEESKRMRKLVDNSYASDPRILKFRYKLSTIFFGSASMDFDGSGFKRRNDDKKITVNS
jgi:hypothetical protein